MMKNVSLDFGSLPEIIGGKILVSASPDMPVEFLLLDSRKITNSAYSIFFAISGDRHDGHNFIDEVYQSGISQFVVEKDKNIIPDNYPDCNIIEVNNAIEALQNLVKYHRNKFSLPVFGITGSNGKTIIKEWLSQLLSYDYSVVKSPKSYNSQVGVPLSVWQINQLHEIGIFEAGISRINEMDNLGAIIQPSYGIFTNIGSAHDEGFKNRNQKIEEKLKLFRNCKTIFYCIDHQPIYDAIIKISNDTFTWSKKDNKADLNFEIKKQKSGKTFIKVKGEDLELPFRDEASVENLLHCIAVLYFFNIPFNEIQKRLNQIERISMRLELKQGINGCYLIDDTYNNDIGGLKIALDYLKQQNQKVNKTIILSDLLEAGLNDEHVYREVAELIEEYPVTRMIGIGKQIAAHQEFFELPSFFYSDTNDFLKDIDPDIFKDEVILIKGARFFQFEKIIDLIQEKVHGTILEINLDSLAHNLNFYRSRLKAGTNVMAMVKAFAYGNGNIEVANLLQFQRIDYLGVAYADEGVTLRQNGITTPIMVMNPAAETFEKLIQYDLEPDIYGLRILKLFTDFIHATGYTSKIHLELETGMNRLGIAENELDDVLDIIEATSGLKIQSVFSHLAGADEAGLNEFSHQQFTRYQLMVDKIGKRFNIPMKHILNSAGIIRFPEYQLDMVRLGIGLYGVEATGKKQDYLQNVATLKTVLSQIKYIKKGETVGYGRKGVAENDMRIGIIAIGYGDGYARHFSNGVGKVMVRGQYAPVIGNICMDMTMIYLGDIPAEEGDEVILFGKEIPITELASSINTIPYEILTNVSERVKRIFYSE